jgi:acetyltransferase-like isoleucine patch superfamily enzyme
MLIHSFKQMLARFALSSGRLVGLYRRLCRPTGFQWARYLKERGGLYAMGEGCCIQTNVVFTDPGHVRLGDNVHLSGCTLFGHDGAVNMIKQSTGVRLDRVGKIDIRDNVFVGHQAIIMPGVTIGPNAIVGAGAVVTSDVPPDSVVGGVPARRICSLATYAARCAEETDALPWRDHPNLAPTYFGGAHADLTEARKRHFFSQPCHVPFGGSAS